MRAGKVRLFILVPALLYAAAAYSQQPLYSGTIIAVNGNQVTADPGTNFSGVNFDVLEITSGSAQGSRFLIMGSQGDILFCDTGLLNDPSTTVVGAGVAAGSGYDVLNSDLLVSDTGIRRGDLSILDADANWTTDFYKGSYVYLSGTISGSTVQSFYEIQSNASNIIFVSQPLPAYSDVSYRIITNPSSAPPPNDYPQVQMGTDSVLESDGELRSVAVTLTPGDKLSNNEIDLYCAVLDPLGRLFFLRDGRWHGSARAVVRDLFIGSSSNAVLGVFKLGAGIPKGQYILYGVCVAPGASVFSTGMWRSNLSRVSFFVQ